MPLASADPFGGLIITDWYQPPESPDERLKVHVLILRPRAAGRRRQGLGLPPDAATGGDWVDAPVDPKTSTELEDKILTKARELRIASLAGQPAELRLGSGRPAAREPAGRRRLCAADGFRRATIGLPCRATRSAPPRRSGSGSGQERRSFRAEADPARPEILRARDVPLSVGAHPHGARPQLHDGRRGRPAEARPRASTCCTRWAGTPSACRPRTRRSRRASTRRRGPTTTSPRCATQMKPMGLLARLVARDRDLRSGLLRPRAGDVPRHARARPRLPQGELGQLGPGRPDRAGQRAGDRRPRLALRRRRSSGASWPSGSSASPPIADELLEALDGLDALAREGAADAAQLDRQVDAAPAFGFAIVRAASRAARGLHHPAGHAVRRLVRGDRARPSAGAGAGAREPGAGRLRRRVPAGRHQRGRDRDRRRSGASTPDALPPPVRRRTGCCRSTSPTSS